MRMPAGDLHAGDAALLEHAAQLEQYRASLMAFADTTASFWAALVAIRWVGPDGDYERVPEFLHRQCSRRRETNHLFARQLCELGAPGKLPVMTGDTIPDFFLPMSGGDTSPFLDTLHVTTIPANFLLDFNGRVVAKNLHGDALRNFVDRYLAR